MKFFKRRKRKLILLLMQKITPVLRKEFLMQFAYITVFKTLTRWKGKEEGAVYNNR